MSDLKITIEPEEQEKTADLSNNKVATPLQKSNIKMNMKIRRTLDGSAMIFDHVNIDIIVNTKKMKVLAFAKGDFSDHSYATQNRMFEFLVKKGIIDPATIKGGHVYGSFEGKIFEPTDDIPLDQVVILNIGKWMEEERPQMNFDKQYEENFNDYLTEPDEEDTTELGEVPQKAEKGTIPKTDTRRYVGRLVI